MTRLQAERIAAITYPGIANIDLSPYSRLNLPPAWNAIGAPRRKSAISHFAWDVRGGDSIYVADTDAMIIGMGFVRAPLNELGYRFDSTSSISTPNEGLWRHTLPVDWDDSFVPTEFRPVKEPQVTVIPLSDTDAQKIERASQQKMHETDQLTPKDLERERFFCQLRIRAIQPPPRG